MSQVTLDFSLAGFGTGIVKALKVIGYHVASDVLIVAAAYLAHYDPSHVQARYAAIVALAIAVTNALIKGGEEWLTTVKPTQDPTSALVADVAAIDNAS